MSKLTIFVLIAFLAAASALTSSLQESLFYVDKGNSFSYQLAQTRRGIIVRDTAEYTGDVYLLIDLPTRNSSMILADIVAACTGGKSSHYDRLHFHVATSTLLYYCINNNTLLVIDEDSYTVELTIPTNVNATFDDVMLIPQGYSIAILGITGLLTQSTGPAQVITIDLQSQTIANHLVFNYGLSPEETVIGYAVSSKNQQYLMTTINNGYNHQVTIYSMFAIGSSYTITNMTSISYYLNYDYPIFSNIYCVEDLIVVSTAQELSIITQEGDILGTVQNIATKFPFAWCEATSVALVTEYGSSDFYALLANETLVKFSAANGGYSYEAIGYNIIDMQYVASNLSSDSLLFTTDSFGVFNITDLQTSQVVYTTIVAPTDFMITDTTYALVGVVTQDPVLYIFDRETNLLISKMPIGFGDYYYELKTHIISYMDYTNSSQSQCHMVQVDIQTANTYIPFILDPSYGNDCANYNFKNVTNDLDTPQFVLTTDNTFVIVSENFGLVTFMSFEFSYGNGAVFIDYDTLAIQYVEAVTQVYNYLTIYSYNYNASTQTFTTPTQDTIGDIPIASIFDVYGQLLILSSYPEFEFVNTATLSTTKVPYSGSMGSLSMFQDKSDATYLMFSGYGGSNPMMYSGYGFSPVPGSTSQTVSTQAAGVCSYVVTDKVVDINVVRFYTVCPSQEDLSTIYA